LRFAAPLFMRKFFIIAPAYNEAESIGAFIGEVGRVCRQELAELECLIVIVDDGSTDQTMEEAVKTGQAGLRVVRLSRNFGQQAAQQAGLDAARADSDADSLFCLMDSDLQHPPEELPRLARELLGGADHVQMLRRDGSSLPWGKRMTSAAYYFVLRVLTGLPMAAGSADFRGLSRKVVDAYCSLSEHGRFNRGLFYWAGFRRVDLEYVPAERRRGETKYSYARMLRLAARGILQFSSAPLIVLNLATFALSMTICGGYLIWEFLRFQRGVVMAIGWPTIMAFVSFWGGVISFNQLVQSLYIARVFDEAKRRPNYFVERQYP
jgi:polyisoprenyl-phosphate glycosyltransferase